MKWGSILNSFMAGRYHIETSPMDWFLYDYDLRHERVNLAFAT